MGKSKKEKKKHHKHHEVHYRLDGAPARPADALRAHPPAKEGDWYTWTDGKRTLLRYGVLEEGGEDRVREAVGEGKDGEIRLRAAHFSPLPVPRQQGAHPAAHPPTPRPPFPHPPSTSSTAKHLPFTLSESERETLDYVNLLLSRLGSEFRFHLEPPPAAPAGAQVVHERHVRVEEDKVDDDAEKEALRRENARLVGMVARLEAELARERDEHRSEVTRLEMLVQRGDEGSEAREHALRVRLRHAKAEIVKLEEELLAAMDSAVTIGSGFLASWATDPPHVHVSRESVRTERREERLRRE